MLIPLPDDVRHILRVLNDDGHAAYAVGGCVRDCLMGLIPKDWDIATAAPPPRVKQLFKRTIDTGLQHGTVTVLLNRVRYEVTTFRVDGDYLDGRRPSAVRFTSRIEDDVSRRDFTMNAIAYHPDEGFADPFGGREDITRRVIRCVGRPEHRFTEDALRMLRAVRFAAQLGFSVEPETIAAIPPLCERLALVSAERIREELTRLLTAAHPEAALLLQTTGLLPYVLRGRAYQGDLQEAVRRIKKCPKQTAMVYALFLAWAGNDGAAILRDLRFDNKTARETALYITALPQPLPPPYDRYAVKKALRRFSPVYFDRWLTLKTLQTPSELLMASNEQLYTASDEQLLTASDEQLLTASGEQFPTASDEQIVSDDIPSLREVAADILAGGECFTLDTLAVNGDDLAAAGIARGKGMGDMLADLLDAVMHDPALNTKEALLALSAIQKQQLTV